MISLPPGREIIEIDQGTTEWQQVRTGMATASRFSDVMATIKSGEAAVRKNYRAELVLERLTGKYVDQYVSGPMIWGREQEPFARAAYEIETGSVVDQAGFIRMKDSKIGYSPDGMVEDGIIEIKCPNSSTHMETLISGKMSPGHMPQVQGGMWLRGAAWCDFISFDPRMPEEMQLFVQRIKRDSAYIIELEVGVTEFLNTVDEMHDALVKKFRRKK